MKPIYKIDIDLADEEICFDFNSTVDFPAHIRAFDKYNDKPQRLFFAEPAKQRITGVMIAANIPIYRNDPYFGEHFVVFFPEEIEKLWIRWNEFGFTNNLNKQHDPSRVVSTKDAFLIEQWIVDRANNKGVPKSLEKQMIQDGSLMASYQIKDPKFWKDIVDGKFNGFSIEGIFLKSPLTVNKVPVQQQNVALTTDQLELRNVFFQLQKGQK